MALDYFHFSNGHTTIDEVGTNLSDLSSVREEALRALRELLNLGHSDCLWTSDLWKVWVTDQPNAAGRAVLTLEVNAR